MLTIDNVPVPFIADIKNGLPYDAVVDLTGVATYGKDQAIWFEYKTHDGTALYLSIRMGNRNQHLIVVNSYHSGHWGTEETHHNDAYPSGPLHINVECQDHQFKILVNSRSFHFPHRLKKHEITRLEVTGDLMIQRMSFRNMDNHVQLLGNYQSASVPFSQPYGGPTAVPSVLSPFVNQSYPAPQPYPNQMGQGYYPNQGTPQTNYPHSSLGQPPPSAPYPNAYTGPQLQTSYPNQPNSSLGQPPPSAPSSYYYSK